MSFTQVDSSDMGVTGLADTPALTTSAMQAKFDELGNLACDGLNNLIEELEATTAAASVGAVVPTSISASANLQAIINAMNVILQKCETARHTHSDIDTLDTITAELKEEYDRLVTLFSTITAIDYSTVSDAYTCIPSSKAVTNLVENLDISDKVIDLVYPVGAVYVSKSSTTPASSFGGTWQQVSIGISGAKAWQRLS